MGEAKRLVPASRSAGWGAAMLLPYIFVRLLLGRFFLLGFL